MVTYNSLYNEIQRRYNAGEITYEQACDVNDLAYERYVVEDKIEGLMRNARIEPDLNSQFGKELRKVQILNSELKRGKITKSQYEKKFNDIRERSSHKRYIDRCKYNIASATYNRPNKEKSKISPKDFNPRNTVHGRRHDNIDANTTEKIERHLSICNETDDEREFQQHRRALCKIFGLPADSTLKDINHQIKTDGTSTIFLNGYSKKDDNELSKGNTGYHSTTKKDLEYLKPAFRSKDGVLYSSSRVYINKNKGGSRFGNSKSENEVEYEVDTRNKNIKEDPELRGGNAGYIETKDKLKIIKKNKKNKKDY